MMRLLRQSIASVLLLVFLNSAPAETPAIDVEIGPSMSVQSPGRLANIPARNEAFMDWGLGMFLHWSLDSQRGSVISHSLVGASDQYVGRFFNELPKSFDPRRYDPNDWMEIAKVAGVKYVVFTTKHQSGFCMWDTKTTDFSIMHTSYGKDIVRAYVDACRKAGIKVGFYFSPEDFHYLHQVGEIIRRVGGTRKEKPGLMAYDKKQLDELLGNYGPIDVKRIYNNNAWPNAVVVKLNHVEFVGK